MVRSTYIEDDSSTAIAGNTMRAPNYRQPSIPKLINIVKDLMEGEQFKENLRRIDGPKTLLG